MVQPAVSIVRDVDLVKRVNHAVELIGGIEKFVGKGDKVLIKPNLVGCDPPETGETVHPETIRTLTRLAKTAGASKITVGDALLSRDLSLKKKMQNIFQGIAEKEKAEMINFDEHPYVEVEVKDPIYFKKIKVAETLLECDVLINIPTLKTHHLAGITVALKNLYGFLPREDRFRYHSADKIEEIIVDLNIVRRSDLIVVDGTYSTHHRPPFDIQRMDLALAGNDPVAVDAVAAKVMGVDLKTLRNLKWAEERGLGTSNLSEIQIFGLSVDEAFRRKTATVIDYVHRNYDKIKLINGGACTGCFGRISTMFLWPRKYDVESLKEELYILMGPEAKLPNSKNIILCGNCLAPTFYNKLRGEFVPGCPPDLEAFKKALENFGLKENFICPHGRVA